MTGAFELRRYEPADRDRVWAVHESALRASALEFVEDEPADADVARIRERYLDAGGEFLVGLREGEIVAIGGFRVRDADAVEIRRMRVDPDHQRRGYGRRVLTELEARARERGFERSVLHTHEALTAARRLYADHGYTVTRREPHPVSGDELIHYEKSL